MDSMPTAGQPEIPGFQVLREIGRGATSRVYLARQEALQRDVALKVITTLGERGRRRALRLFREARLAGALDHANIVRGIDAGEEKDYCWFAMEYVPGGTLLDAMARSGGRLDPARVAKIGIQLLAALDHAHDRGVVHRDLKPANVLVDVEGRVHLLDLGLARHTADTKLTQEGGTLGTPQYMAPEQAREARLVDARSDLFSLGATLYHALTGVPPFEAETVANVLTRLLYEEPEAPSTLVPELAPAWDIFFLRALAKEPKQRYQAAVEMARDLRAVSRGVAPSSPVEAQAGRRKRTLLIATGVAVLLFGAAGVLWHFSDGSPGDGETETSTEKGDGVAPPVDPHQRAWRRFATRLSSQDVDALSTVALAHLLREAPEPLPDAAARARMAGLSETLATRWKADLEEEREATLTRLRAGDLTPELLSRFLEPRFPVGDLETSMQARIAKLAAQEAGRRAQAVDREREALAKRLEQTLDAVVAALRADPTEEEGSAVGRRIDAALDKTGDADLLDAGRRDLLMERRRQLLKDLARAPLARYEKDRQRAERLVQEGRYRDALQAIERLETDHAGVGVALSVGADLRGVVERRSAALRKTAEALQGELVRRTHDALPPPEWKRRRDALAAGIADLPDATQVPGLEPLVTEARGVLRLLEAALALEEGLGDAVKRAARDGGSAPLPLRRLSGGPRRPWRVLGLDESGRKVSMRRASDGFAQEWPLRDLDVASRLALWDASGLPADPLGRAAYATLHGEDDLAQRLLASTAEGEAGRESLKQAVESAQEAFVASRATEPEREAARWLLRLRRSLHAGDLVEIEKAKTQLEALRRRHKSAAFFREEGPEIKRRLKEASALLETGAAEKAARERFAFTRFEPATGVGLIEIPVPRPEAHPLLDLPAGSKEMRGAVRIDPGTGAWRTPPWKLEPVTIALPTEGAKKVRFECTVRFPGPEPPAALQISLFDFGFLGIANLRESLQYRGEPLHGLERDLFRHTAYQRVAAWVGAFRDPPKGLPSRGTPFGVELGKPLSIAMEIEPGKGRGSILVGGVAVPLPRGGRPRGAIEGIEIRGFPFFDLSNIFIEVETDL